MKRSKLRRRYGRSSVHSVKRAAWMRTFSDAATKMGAHPGRLAWDEAHHLFNSGVSPIVAAHLVVKR